MKWNLLTAIRIWHSDTPSPEEATTRMCWPLTLHCCKGILMVKYFQSHDAGAWFLLRKYQKDLPLSAYQDGTCTLPVICTWTVFHSWPYRESHTFCHSPGAARTLLNVLVIRCGDLSVQCERFGGNSTLRPHLEIFQPDFMTERLSQSMKTTNTQGISLVVLGNTILIFPIWFRNFWNLTGPKPLKQW